MHLEWKEEDYIHVERTKVRGRYLYGFEVVLCLKAQNVNHAVLMCGFVDHLEFAKEVFPYLQNEKPNAVFLNNRLAQL